MLTPATARITSGFMGLALIQPGERIGEHYHPVLRGVRVARSTAPSKWTWTAGDTWPCGPIRVC